MPRRKKQETRGRPSLKHWPEPIDAPPERVAEVVLRAKPKKVWRYMEEEAKRRESSE